MHNETYALAVLLKHAELSSLVASHQRLSTEQREMSHRLQRAEADATAAKEEAETLRREKHQLTQQLEVQQPPPHTHTHIHTYTYTHTCTHMLSPIDFCFPATYRHTPQHVACMRVTGDAQCVCGAGGANGSRAAVHESAAHRRHCNTEVSTCACDVMHCVCPCVYVRVCACVRVQR